MKKQIPTAVCGRIALCVLMVAQLGMAQTNVMAYTGIDTELQKKAQLLSPSLQREWALRMEESRVESSELYIQALKRCDEGKFKDAYILLTESLNKDARNFAAKTKLAMVNGILYDSYAGYGNSRMAVRDYQGAVDNYLIALEHKPDGKEAQDGIERARSLLEQAVSKNIGKIITEDMSDEEKVDMLMKQARDLEVQSRYEEAQALYKQAMKVESEDPRPRRALKDLIEKQGRIIDDERRIDRRNVMERFIRDFLQNPEDLVEEGGTTGTVVTPAAKRRAEMIKMAKDKKLESFSFSGAPIQDVVNYIADMSGMNIVLSIGDKAANPVNAELKDVSVLDAVDYIVGNNPGLTYTIDEYAIVITRGEGEMEQRFWVVSEVQNRQAEENRAGSSSGGAATDIFSTPETTTPDVAAPGDVAQPEVVRMINELLPGLRERGGAVFYEGSSRTLTVRATANELDRIGDLIARLDQGEKQNQVEIQARFVELSDFDLEELSLGLKLEDSFKLFGLGDRQDRAAMLNPIDLTGALRRYAKGENASRYADKLNKLFAFTGTKAGQNQAADLVIGFFTSAITDPEVGLVFHAISEKTNADVLSAPSVTTVSGQSRVKIKQIMEVMYPEDYTIYKPAKVFSAVGGGIAGGLASTTLLDVQQGYATVQGFKTEEVGIELTVSPTISEDGKTVDMEVNTKVSKELEPHLVIAYVGDNSTYPALDPIELKIPRFKNSEVTTQVVVNDGETIVLGGMVTEVLRQYHDKVPFWGDLPLVGKWFRADGSYQDKKNLMIFLTVRVITPRGELFSNLVKREQAQIALDTASGKIEMPPVEDTGTPAGTTNETGAVETPSTETPATETPATETPATETPATETPATETPATETPATETPATETPATETPAAGTATEAGTTSGDSTGSTDAAEKSE